MAVVTIVNEGRTLTTVPEITSHLAGLGIDYQVWEPGNPVDNDAPADVILAAYAREIDELKLRGGYVTADVIDIKPATPGLDAMLAKFSREHWHDEDEVRFIISGRGLFHVRSDEDSVVAIQVEQGDLIRVPRGTKHWFNLCAERQIRAIRLFQDPSGWVPNYTETGVDQKYQPVCLGQTYLPVAGSI